jgi:hypothetical protein
MDKRLWALSPQRMEPYLKVCGGDRAAAFRLYDWNIDISGAFGRPLGCLEVVCRNAIHRQLAVLFVRQDWWDQPGDWLSEHARLAVTAAKRELCKHGKDRTADRIVAELPFGFWVGLVSKRNNYEMKFWRPALHKAFPGFSGKPGELYEKLNLARLLRNRISHLEPIHGRDLAADYATTCRLIGHVSTEVADWVRVHPGVRDVLARKPAHGTD